jgi:hypothetical protein
MGQTEKVGFGKNNSAADANQALRIDVIDVILTNGAL